MLKLNIKYTIFFTCCCLSLIGQVDQTLEKGYGTFRDSQIVNVALPQTPVYTAPSVQAEILTDVELDEALLVIEKMDETDHQKGVTTNWYAVQTPLGELAYIQGAQLALSTVYLPDKITTVRYAIDRRVWVDRGAYKEPVLMLSIIAAQKKQLIDSIHISAIGSVFTQTQMRTATNKGFEPIQALIEIDYSDGYCGGVSATSLLFWRNRKFYFIDILVNSLGEEHFSTSRFIFPNEKGGLPGRVQKEYARGYLNTKGVYIYEEQRLETYYWQKTKLVKDVH